MGEDKAPAARKARNAEKTQPKRQPKKRRADETEDGEAGQAAAPEQGKAGGSPTTSTQSELRAGHAMPAMMQKEGKEMQILYDPNGELKPGEPVLVTSSSGRPIPTIAEYHAFGDPVVIRRL